MNQITHPQTATTSGHSSVLWTTVAVCLFVTMLTGEARPYEDQKRTRRPADYRSDNFLIHTDLTEDDAAELLQKMETMLKLISRYWGAENRKTIECYVVDDVANWPDRSLPADAIDAVRGGGVTIARSSFRGRQMNTNAIVYASNRFGTPLHEAVHAYCYQTFGRTGPTWYAEGMAEMGNYWVEDDPTVTAPDYVIRYLRESPRKSLAEITDNRQRTGDGWQNYAWRWALCHFLVNNSNYHDRFRPMGVGFLTDRQVSFQQTYESQMPELEFEFQFFLDHLERGFDIGRCTWNWKANHRKPRSGGTVTSTIKADRGWQSGGLKVEQGQTYRFAASGIWQTIEKSAGVSATGDGRGRGRLVGALVTDYRLSDAFDLGRKGTFTAKADGTLWLRCRDEWNALADNKGKVTVEFSAVESQ